MKITIKSGVAFKEINEHTMRFFNVLSGLGTLLGIPRTITSANDGKHQGSAPLGQPSNSLHYKDLAWDSRSKDLLEREKIAALTYLKQELGEDWDVILERPGEYREHFHAEFQKKRGDIG